MYKKLSATNIKYILAIHDLSTNYNEKVRNVEVAKYLQISKPSVHAMLNTLCEMYIIAKKAGGVIMFTPEGSRLANQYKMFYDAWERYLSKVLLNCPNRKAAIYAIIAELSEEENKRIHEVI